MHNFHRSLKYGGLIMTEKEIIQAANEYFEAEAIDVRDDLDFYKVYRAGVIYGQKHPESPWISVKDDLPCNHEELMVQDEKADGKLKGF